MYVVRAFVQLRELVVSHKELALRLDDLENKTELMSLKHASPRSADFQKLRHSFGQNWRDSINCATIAPQAYETAPTLQCHPALTY